VCLILCYVNIAGNETADTAANSALSLPVNEMKIQANELILCIPQFCLKEWQDIWYSCEGNKIHAVYRSIGKISRCKKCTVVMNHTLALHMCHVHLLTGKDLPTCQCYSLPLTVMHILVLTKTQSDTDSRDMRIVFFSFESRIESAVRFVFESNIRIESAVYHASRNIA